MGRKVAIFGCGAVGKCVLYYLTRFIRVSYKNVSIVDCMEAESKFPAVQECIASGATFLKYKITSANVEELINDVLRLKAGDAIIDLTTRTPTMKIFAECRRRQLFYINTDIYDESVPLPIVNNTLDGAIRATHAIIDDVYRKTEHHGKVTHVLECGMNPGLISIFVKRGLVDMAKWVQSKCKAKARRPQMEELKLALSSCDYHGIAKALGVRVIHCSEIDTQVPTVKQINKGCFMNTWSCVGLIDEGLEPAEIAVGTHEQVIPFAPKRVEMAFPQIALLGKDGIKVQSRSYVPIATKTEEGAQTVEFKEIQGRCVHHGESISLNIFLGRDDYAPTMHYVYAMNPTTEAQLQTMNRRQLLRASLDPAKMHVMNAHQDKLHGTDNVGACFLLDANPITGEKKPWGWWCGSMLDTDTVRNDLNDPYFGPTVIQVMAGVLSGLSWAMKHPERGLMFTENIDGRYILKKAKKYLGTIYSGPITCPIVGTTLKELMIGKRLKHTNITSM